MSEIAYKKPLWRQLWFAFFVCGILLALSLIPAISEALHVIDISAAKWLNRGAGVSPVFDRFVLLIADSEGRERITFLVILWFIGALWMAPNRLEKSRLMGTLLFSVIVIGIYFLIDNSLDDVIERHSPSFFLKEQGTFRSIEEILNFDVDLTDRRSFPNAEGVILFALGFMLLRLRRIKGATVAILLGLTAPLLRCVAGLNWVTDIYLGSLPVGFLLSAVAVESPFFRLYHRMVEASAAAIDQVEKFRRDLGPMWRHRKLYWASQNVFHMETAVKRFISKELPTILDKQKLHHHSTPVVEVPLGGLRSVIRIVSYGPLKAVLRAYPLNRRFEADRHFRASNLLRKHKVRVPEIYYHSESPKNYGALFLVEEFIDGHSKAPSDLTDENLSAAAAELAHLHSVTNEVWGMINAPRTEEYGNVLIRRIERQLGQLERGQILRGQQDNIAAVRRWFNQWHSQLNGIRKFSLIHGFLHRENCIFETSGRFCLLDITTLEWGIPTADIVTIHHSLCGSREELIRKFDENYYAALPSEDAAHWNKLVPLYEAMYCLSQVAKYNKRRSRLQRRHVGDVVTKGTHWWHELLKIVEARPHH